MQPLSIHCACVRCECWVCVYRFCDLALRIRLCGCILVRCRFHRSFASFDYTLCHDLCQSHILTAGPMCFVCCLDPNSGAYVCAIYCMDDRRRSAVIVAGAIAVQFVLVCAVAFAAH